MSLLVRMALGLGAALALAPPAVGLETPGRGGRAAAAAGPAELESGGGVLTLAAPASTMILVPESTFTMGSTDDEIVAALADCQARSPGHYCTQSLFSAEGPAHEVTLSAFLLDRTEVTVADYARCAAVSRCNPLPLGEGARRFDRPRFPASLVTWEEARDYCAFRGGRLPTEAEFERAARGTSGRRFPWGNLYNAHVANHGKYDWNDVAAVAGGNPTDGRDGFVELAPVGSFPEGRTPEGFLDLAGNVAEWVNDRFAERYDEGPARDPTGPTTGTVARVVRGGSYESGPLSIRGAARQAASPGWRHPSRGFRCAKTPVR